MSTLPVCVVVGTGPGNGAAFARRFHADGYAVALLARSREYSNQLASSLSNARAFACDVTDAAAVERTFEEIRSSLGEPVVVIYNASNYAFGTLEQISPAAFDEAYRVNVLGAFLVAKQVVPGMKRAGGGSFVFIGATASRRGTARGTALGPAKMAQRGLAESLARQLWPSQIHVALIVIDGIVGTPAALRNWPDKPESFFIKPEDVAASAAGLVGQPRSAWSFEVEARPFGESW